MPPHSSKAVQDNPGEQLWLHMMEDCLRVDFERGKEEFRAFVCQTWRALLQLEQSQLRHETGLSLFCRMDIGIMMNPSGQYDFFINEVERTMASTMLINSIRESPFQLVVREIAHQLPAYVSRCRTSFSSYMAL